MADLQKIEFGDTSAQFREKHNALVDEMNRVRSGGFFSQVGNVDDTTIAEAGEYVRVVGDLSVIEAQHFVIEQGVRMVCTDPVPRRYTLDSDMTISNGTNARFAVRYRVSIDGSEFLCGQCEGRETLPTGGTPTTVSIKARVTLKEGDWAEPVLTRVSSTGTLKAVNNTTEIREIQ